MKASKMKDKDSKRWQKAIIGVLLALIMLLSVVSILSHSTSGSDVTQTTVRNGYIVNPDNVTISMDGNTTFVLIGQNVQFMCGGNKTGSVTAIGVEGTPAKGHVVTSNSTGWLNTSGMIEGLYNATYENQWELLSVDSPYMALWFKVGETGVSSITQGTPLGICFTSNLDVNDCVDLKVVTPEGYVLTQNLADHDQKFDDINVSKLLEYGSENESKRINTTGWKVGTYTFWVRPEEENARGLDVSTCAITLAVYKADITIEAEKTSIVELEKVRLTVAGGLYHNITLNSSDAAHTIFPAGYEDNPPYDTSGPFDDIIDSPDGRKEYAVCFNDTGTYTITVTDTTAGLDDSIDITVSEKAVTFSMPSTWIIGRNLTISGTANAGETIDIAIDDYVRPELNDVIINEFGCFEAEIETDWMIPGSYRIKGFIGRAVGPGDASGEDYDGAITILMIEEGLTVNLSTDTVSLGNSFEIYGSSRQDYVEIVAISPKGGNGTGTDGLYGVMIDTVPTLNYNFYRKIKVDGEADTGNYTIIVLSSGRDGVYGLSSYEYIDSILDLDGAGPELGAIDVSDKTQEEIISIIEDVTINQAGSDDLIWTGHLTVYQSKVIYVDDDFEDDPANHRWNTIQEGINDANDGDTIIVMDGIYTENVDVNKRLTIKSENGSALTIVQAANPDDHVFEVTADYVNILGFTVKGATHRAGIYLDCIDYCNVTNNNISNNEYGIVLFDSSNIEINNNTITNAKKAIICDSSNSTIYNNVIVNNSGYGIGCIHSSNSIITNNIITNNGFGIECYSYSNPIITTNAIISNYNYGISCFESSDPTITYNNISDNGADGIFCSCSSPTLIGNTISNNYDYGIRLICTSNTTIIGNRLNSNREDGLFLDYSSNNAIINNTLLNNYAGIHLSDSSKNSINNNTVLNNEKGGILLYHSSTDNTVSGNIVSWNDNVGIYLSSSSNSNTIITNTVSKNCCGIRLHYSSNNNKIYFNNFINNTDNAYSYNSTNTWNSTTPIIYTHNGTAYTNYLGNYWSDYNGSDLNGDGVGDTPYSIDGDNDSYPLMMPWENYFAPTPTNIFDTGHGTYPSISGRHNGTIKPNQTITVQKLYTYPCSGTGGHTEYAAFYYSNGTLIAEAHWNGYVGDWRNISFNKSFTLQANETYNYTIKTGSYPQIIHKSPFIATGGTIACDKFIDANGRVYYSWIPAIRLS